MELADALDQTFEHAHNVIAGVRPDQLGGTTPCDEWSVRDLLTHTIGVVAGMGASVRGEARGPRPDGVQLGDDPAAQFRAAADGTIAAWRQPGVMDRVVDGPGGRMPGRVLAGINLLDTATHTWDLAVATGQSPALPDAVAEAALEASRQIVSPELRAGRFAAEVTTPAEAGATDRLVAFLGRQPT